MNVRSILLVATLLLLPTLSLLAGCDADAADVRRTDILYDQSLDAGDGTQAVTFLSKASLKWLDDRMVQARTLTRSKVERLPYSERFEVLQIRLLLSPSEVRKLDGRGYYIRLVNKGWVGSTSDQKRGRITFNKAKDRATITYRDPDTDLPHRGYYVKEDGLWKEDRPELAADQDRDIRSLANAAGMSEEQLLLRQFEAITRSEVPERVWSPPE